MSKHSIKFLSSVLVALSLAAAQPADGPLGFRIDDVVIDSFGISVSWTTDQEPPYTVGVFALDELSLARWYPLAKAEVVGNKAFVAGNYTDLGVFVQVGKSSSFDFKGIRPAASVAAYRAFVHSPQEVLLRKAVDRYQKTFMRLVADHQRQGFIEGNIGGSILDIHLGTTFQKVSLGTWTRPHVEYKMASAESTRAFLVGFGDALVTWTINKKTGLQEAVVGGTRILDVNEYGEVEPVPETIWHSEVLKTGNIITNITYFEAQTVTNSYFNANVQLVQEEIVIPAYSVTNLVAETWTNNFTVSGTEWWRPNSVATFNECAKSDEMFELRAIPPRVLSLSLDNDTQTGSGWRVFLNETNLTATAVRAYSTFPDISDESIIPRGFRSLSAYKGRKRTSDGYGRPAWAVETNAVPKKIYGGGL